MNNTAPARALVVSIHDVSPLTLEPVRGILADLHRIGVDKTSLLVVPDHHHRGNILQNPAFCSWLKERAAEGHEIVIHGYYHRRERKSGETLWQRLMTQTYTADEGEFYDIDTAAAAALVTRARDEFATIGLRPDGFIAPAWLLSPNGEQALRDLRFRYTTRLRNVLDLERGRRHDSMSLVYSVRSGWRRSVSLVWNSILFQRERSNSLLRVSIHPVDIAHKKIWQQILDITARALEDRTPMTYSGWIAAQTESRSLHAQG